MTIDSRPASPSPPPLPHTQHIHCFCIVYSIRNAEKEDYSVALSKDSLCVHELYNCLKKIPWDQNVAKYDALKD